MPIPGVKPNEGRPIRHRVKPTYQWIDVEDKPYRNTRHHLPAAMPDGRPWPEMTVGWWQAVSTMPHCRLWNRADWAFALDTALVAAAFHSGHLGQAVELRMREKVMGTTLDARRDLRIRYVKPKPKEERAGVTAIEEYRRRLEG
jgi:hypothetical protein